MRYGAHRSNVADLWRPEPGRTDDPVPVVVLIHGGFWRARYTRSLMDGLARSVSTRGWSAWNIEYRRVGTFGGGGGWPATFEDVAAAVDHVRTLPGIDPERVATCGHSAGGQLALWAAARTPTTPVGPGGAGPARPGRVSPCVAVSLAGVVDLRQADRLRLGADAVAGLLGGHWDEREARYRAVSPAELLPLGVPQVLVHGARDEVVPPSMSRGYQVEAVKAGDRATYIAVDGAGHRDVIDPDSSAWAATLSALEPHLG
jgi:acetyl esterase/lipase